jgi:hypothetical protein
VRNSNQPFSLSILPSLFSFSIWRLASDKHDLTVDATVTVVATGARVNRDPRQVPISPTPRRGRRHRRREDWLWRHHLPPRCRPHLPPFAIIISIHTHNLASCHHHQTKTTAMGCAPSKEDAEGGAESRYRASARACAPYSLLWTATRAHAPTIATRPCLPCTHDSMMTANKQIRAGDGKLLEPRGGRNKDHGSTAWAGIVGPW